MTRPAAPRCATHPIAAATRAEINAAGTTAIPAICATPISGMARKLRPSPANVTRENTNAPIGNSSASVAARSGEHRQRRAQTAASRAVLNRRNHDQDRQRRAECEQKRGIGDRQRIGRDEAGGDQRQRVERRAAVIDSARGEVHRGHQRRAIDRRAAADQTPRRQPATPIAETIAVRPSTPARRKNPISKPARMAMLPPEIAIT